MTIDYSDASKPTFDKNDDTANARLYSAGLVDEINNSGNITPTVLHIDTVGSVATINLDASLPSGEQSALTTLINNHDGVIPEFVQSVKINGPANTDQRPIIHETPRKFGTVTYFTGAGDDPANEYNTGGASGQLMAWHHQIGDGQQTVYVDFNTIENETYLHAGILQWKDALNDDVTCEVVPKTTIYSSGSNTDYTLFGGYLIIPAAPGTGDITVSVNDRVLVEVPLNEQGLRVGAGYFDADWNTVTKQWDNFAPNYAGTGRFNMFGTEVVLDRFANRLPLLGNGISPLGTHDASQFGHNNRGRFTITTNGADHEWWGNCWLTFHRKKTT